MSMDQATIDPGRKESAFRLMFVALSQAKSFQWLGVRAFDLDHYKRIEQEKCVEAGRKELRCLRLTAASLPYVAPCLLYLLLHSKRIPSIKRVIKSLGYFYNVTDQRITNKIIIGKIMASTSDPFERVEGVRRYLAALQTCF